MKNNDRNDSSVETVMMMVLLILLSISILTLIYAGSTTQKRISDEKNIKVSARVASSYIAVTLKKYDQEGDVFVMVNPNTNENALVLRDDPNPEYVNEELFTWIYYENGILYTQTITADDQLIPGLGIEITAIDGFDISIDGNKVTSKILYQNNGTMETMKNVTVLRSLDEK